MFTFDREHEKKCTIARVSGEKNVFLIVKLIDAVHDLLEQQIDSRQLIPISQEAFIEGGSGVWEQTANWLKRLSTEHPELGSLWAMLVKHPSSRVRFRVACCLNCMRAGIAEEIATILASDVSKKMRQRLGVE